MFRNILKTSNHRSTDFLSIGKFRPNSCCHRARDGWRRLREYPNDHGACFVTGADFSISQAIDESFSIHGVNQITVELRARIHAETEFFLRNLIQL